MFRLELGDDINRYTYTKLELPFDIFHKKIIEHKFKLKLNAIEI